MLRNESSLVMLFYISPHEMQSKWSETLEAVLRAAALDNARPTSDRIQELSTAAFEHPDFVVQAKKALHKIRIDLFKLAGLLKHRAFHHEREWRFVLPLSPDRKNTFLSNPIRYRSVNGTTIPYIAHGLTILGLRTSTSDYDSLMLPVTDLLLGPESTEEDLLAAQSFLKSHGFDVTARRSHIPLRSF